MTDSSTTQGGPINEALESFLKAQRAAEAAVAQCKSLAGASDELRSTASRMAEILESCAATLTAIQAAEVDLRAQLQESLATLESAHSALDTLGAATADFESRLRQDIASALDSKLGETAGQLEQATQAAVSNGLSQIMTSIESHRTELASSQERLATQLDNAVATVRGELTPGVPMKLRWAGFGQVLTALGAVVAGVGWVVLQLRSGDPYDFTHGDERIAAAWTAVAVVGVVLVGIACSVVGLLKREPRWWLTLLTLVVGVAAIALGGHVALATGIDNVR